MGPSPLVLNQLVSASALLKESYVVHFSSRPAFVLKKMSRLLVLSVLLQLVFFCNTTDVFLSKTKMSGGAAFFPVKRAKLQQLLDGVNSQNDAKFYLPAEPVMQHALKADEHAIMMIFGHEQAISFIPFIGPDDKYTTRSKAFATVVPFLSTTENGVPEVSMSLKTFRSENGGKHVIDAFAVIPTEIQHVDQLIIRDDHVSFMDGDLVFEIQERAKDEECTTPHAHDIEEVGQAEHQLTMSLVAPDFGICQEHPDWTVDYCTVYRKHASDITNAGTNVCEYLLPSANVRPCSTTFEITRASPEVRKWLLLEDDTMESIEATIQDGIFDVHMKVPCVAQQPARRAHSAFYRFLASYK